MAMFIRAQGILLGTSKVWFLLLFVILSMTSLNAQTTGEYRSTGNGNWGTLATWQRWSGSAWVTPTAGQGYPGQNASPALVTIQGGHSVTQNVSPSNTISAITFTAAGATSSLTVNSGNTLNVSGAVTFTNPALISNQSITVNGTANFGSVTMANTTDATRSNRITVATGATLTVSGNITTNGAANENFLELNGTATFNIGGTFTGGTFTISTTSSVNWNGNNANTVRSATYGNLIVSIPASATANRTKALAGNVTVLGTFTLQSLHATNTVALNASSFNFTASGASEINDRGQFIDNNNTGANTFTGAVTVAASGLISSANSSAFTFANSISNDGSILLTANTTSLTGSSVALSGPGEYSFQNLTMNTSGGTNVSYTGSGLLTINGALTFSANGLLDISGTNNIYFGSGATFSGNNNNRYILIDDTNSGTGQLVKYTGNNTNDWRRLYPIGTSTGGYTPLDLSSSTLTTAPANGAELSIKSIYKSGLTGELRRVYRLQVSGNSNATTLANGVFYYNAPTDVSSSDVIGDYNTIWFLDLSSNGWNPVTGTAPGSGFFTGPTLGQSLTSGTFYYTIGTPSAYPNTWYTYQDGNWSNPDVWTLDPSGTTLINPLSQPPAYLDEIVILNGYTVTLDVSGVTLGTTTIQGGGTLDVLTTIGHDLGTISGTGLLKVKSSTLPSGVYTSFVSSSGGTIEYYDMATGGPLSSTQTTYNKLKFTNSTSADIIFVTASNLTVNGNLDITQIGGGGTITWQINDASNTRRTLTINGNLTVSPNGRIRTGTGNEGTGATQPHSLVLFSNFENNGSVKFYDDSDTEFSETEYSNGNVFTNEIQGNTVAVTFRGLTHSTADCNGATDYYRLIVDKGTGQQAMLTLNALNTSNFRLFGPTNIDYSGSAPNFICNNSLALINGTLQLTGNIDIPRLVTSGSGIGQGWPVPQNAALWINGNVTIQVTNGTVSDNGRQIYVFGLLRLTQGTLNTGYSRGLLGGGSGILRIEGGTINTWQVRTTYLGTGNNFAYIQTGGTVNVGTTVSTGVAVNTYPRFALPYSTCSFIMTGGTLNVGLPTPGGTSVNGGIMIKSVASGIQVTGGTVNAYLPPSDINFTITSTAPFYNLNVVKSSAGGTAVANLNPMYFDDTDASNNPDDLAGQPLQILNNLTIVNGNTPTLNTNNLSVTVGGNFDIQANTTYTPGTGTTTFNGSGTQSWTHNGTITSLSDVMINKSAGTLTLGGSGTFPIITGATTGLAIISGTINDGGKILTVSGAMSNSGTHTGTGHINLNGTTTLSGNNGTFGTLRVQTDGAIIVSGKQTITGNLRLTSTNSSLNIGLNNLTVRGAIYSDNGETLQVFGTAKRIITAGQRNDGGLTRKATSAADLLFPVGTGSIYTPATINATATTAGEITVRPVATRHPNVSTTVQSVQYYWKVTSAGFSGLGAVIHKTYTYSSATRDAASTTYRPARYNPNAFTWAYGPTFNATTGAGLTGIPNFNTATSWTGLSTSQLDGEYTAGNVSAFGALTVYYSRVNNGNWNTSNTWSNDVNRVTTSATVPCATCPVVIGNGTTINHTIVVNANNITCGSLQIATNSTLDAGVRTGLNFGANTNEAVTGNGTLRINVAGGPVFPNGDFKDFIGPSGGTVEWYGSDANPYTVPISGPSVTLNSYHNLVITPFTGQTITMPATPLTVFNNMTTSGNGTTATNVSAAYPLTINGDLGVNSGVFQMSCNSAVNSTAFAISGNTTVATGASMLVQNANIGNHTLTTSGSFTNNGTVNFRQTADRYLNLVFAGSNNTALSGTNGAATTTLNAVQVNKGTNQTPVLTINIAGTVTNGLASGWLTLTNGTARFSKASSTFTIINTGTTTFSIPSTACLSVTTGTVNVTTSTDNASDLYLTGKLQVTGGNLNVGTAGTVVHNDIEYASAGSPTIEVAGGTLFVNGAIRRSTSTISGGLVYNQSGGTVTIGGQNTTANNVRGVFEIDYNLGSSFTMSGTSLLQIQRPNGGSTYADLYINPVTSSVSATSSIEMGLNTTAQSFSYNVKPTLGNFTVTGGTGMQTITMYSNPMVLVGNLIVNTGGTLNTNSLDVSLAGNMTINGTYNGAANTTTFNGSSGQSAALSASSSFQNITVNNSGGGVISMSGTSPTITNLNILSGVLNVGSLGLTVNGNVVNNSNQTGSGSIVLSGTNTSQTITSNNGAFTNLILGGSASTKTVYMDGNMVINGMLTFGTTNRYLAIGDDQLTFGTTASVSGAGPTAFIRPNGVSSDLGISKNWAVGSSSFTYAIGTLGNYSPVSMSLNVTTSGTLTVLPINDSHPSYNVGSSERILGTYWIVKRDGTLQYTASGTQTYTYPTTLITGSGGTLVAAYLNISNPAGWITSGHGGTASTTSMTYTNSLGSNLPGVNGSYHYSVGTVNTLPNPLVPVYSRLANANVSNATVGGSWFDANSWTTSSDGMGAPLSNPPYGVPVVILNGARINMVNNGRIAFSARIDGLLVVGNYVGHNLGIMTGTGTMKVSTNTLPAGNFTAFVVSSSGTIEYVAPVTMNNRSTYNNLTISGTGTVTMTNTDLALNGNLTLGSGVTLNNAANNRNITLSGNWASSGTFTPGTGTVTFNGTSSQSISGTNSFYNVALQNATGSIALAGTGAFSVSNSLTLSSNHLITSMVHQLNLSTSATINGASAASFISGPMTKVLASAGSFTFPVGSVSAGRYRPVTLENTSTSDIWSMHYLPTSPTAGGFSVSSFNADNLLKVSSFEYWLISRSGTATADVSLAYNTGSYIPPNIGTPADLRVARWDGAQWDLPPGGGTLSTTGDNIAGTVKITNVSNFSPFTLGSIEEGSALPVTFVYFKGLRESGGVELLWQTAVEQDNDRFDIERSMDGVSFKMIGAVAGHGTTNVSQLYRYHDLTTWPGSHYYYRLKQVDFDGAFQYSSVVFMAAEDAKPIEWSVYPIPMQERLTVEVLGDPLNQPYVEIQVHNIFGQVVYSGAGSPKQLMPGLNDRVKTLTNGVYILSIFESGKKTVFRLIKN